MKNLMTAALSVLLAGSFADVASAVIIAQDRFSYPDGLLVGNGSGDASGWAGPWVEAFGGSGNATDVVGGEAVIGPASNGQRVSRLLDDPIGADGTSAFIGFTGQFPIFYRAFEAHSGGFDDGANRTMQIAWENGGLDGDVGNFGVQGLAAYIGGTVINLDDTLAADRHRYVIQLDFGAGATDSATIFVDDVEVAGPTALANDLAVDRMGFAAFVAAGATLFFDDLILSTTYPSSLACDVNGNGVCNSTDFEIILDNLFTSGGLTDGDLTGDGVVNFADYRLFKDDPARVVGVDSLAAAVETPEPGVVLNMTVASLLLAAGRSGSSRRFARTR